MFFSQSKQVSAKLKKEKGRSKISTFFDLVNCSRKYKTSPHNYEVMGFADLTSEQRKTFFTFYDNIAMMEKYNSKKHEAIFYNKFIFSKVFSDFYGRKKIFILDVVLFGFGSLLIAFSPNIESIFLGRMIQGFGCGGLFPVAGAFIGDAFPLKERGKALGIIGSVFGISAIGGPLVGAALIPFGWNWCFTINIPISIFLVIFAYYILPSDENTTKLKIDYLGIILLSLLAIFLAYGLNQIDSSNFINSLISVNVAPFLIMFIVLIPIFLKIEKRAEESIVAIHMLKNKEIRIACIETLSYGIIYSSVINSSPQIKNE